MTLFPDTRTLLRIEIGDFKLQIAWYAVLILTGALVAYFLSLKNAKKLGYDKKLMEDFFFTMMPIAIVGARLWYVIFEWQQYQDNPIRALYIWEGGLAIHGGLIAGITFAYFFFRKRGVNILRVGDGIMPNVLLAQAIGRWGNFMNQEAFGDVVPASYFDHFPAFIKNQMYIDGAYRQPMFLYESLANILGFILITFVYKKFRKRRGDLIFAYIVWYGIVRYFIEITRSDSLMVGGFKTAQLTSIAFIIIGMLGILGVYHKLFNKIYPFKRNKPVILFDADGTLIDSEKLIRDSFAHTFKTHKNGYELSDEEFISIMGPPLLDTMAKHFDAEQAKQAVATYRSYNHENHDAYVRSMKHAKELLAYLQAEGYEMAVVSNKFRELVIRGLKVSGIDTYFDVVVGGDDVKAGKPSIEGIVKACELLQVPLDEIIFVGDSVVDIQAAKNIEAYSIVLASNNEKKDAILQSAKPKRIINDLLEIKEIVQEENEWSDLAI